MFHLCTKHYHKNTARLANARPSRKSDKADKYVHHSYMYVNVLGSGIYIKVQLKVQYFPCRMRHKSRTIDQ